MGVVVWLLAALAADAVVVLAGVVAWLVLR